MTELAFPVTMTFAALYAIVVSAMIAWIGLYRGRIRVLRGDGGDATLFKRSRIHGNLVEIAPAAILAVGVGEALGLGPEWLWGAVIAFFVGRVLHFVAYDHMIRGLWMGLSSLPAAAIGIWALLTIW